ncbi:hypothetical protein GW17_00002228 [Ensete ventricosum]|nr:hypothetical protein GW17_00002228 [Ensete ventricosum]
MEITHEGGRTITLTVSVAPTVLTADSPANIPTGTVPTARTSTRDHHEPAGAPPSLLATQSAGDKTGCPPRMGSPMVSLRGPQRFPAAARSRETHVT